MKGLTILLSTNNDLNIQALRIACYNQCTVLWLNYLVAQACTERFCFGIFEFTAQRQINICKILIDCNLWEQTEGDGT